MTDRLKNSNDTARADAGMRQILSFVHHLPIDDDVAQCGALSVAQGQRADNSAHVLRCAHHSALQYGHVCDRQRTRGRIIVFCDQTSDREHALVVIQHASLHLQVLDHRTRQGLLGKDRVLCRKILDGIALSVKRSRKRFKQRCQLRALGIKIVHQMNGFSPEIFRGACNIIPITQIGNPKLAFCVVQRTRLKHSCGKHRRKHQARAEQGKDSLPMLHISSLSRKTPHTRSFFLVFYCFIFRDQDTSNTP